MPPMTTSLESCTAQALERLEQMFPGIVARFAMDPFGTLTDELRITVRAVDHLDREREDGGICDGISYLTDGVILYRQTGNRRENFTVAHELGHWLVDQLDEIYDWLADQTEPQKLLETVCDRVAQALLIPDEIANEAVGAGPVTARSLDGLVAATNASRPACAIALSARLPGLGAVVIVDRWSGEVTSASVRPDPVEGWPTVFPWRGQTLSDAHPLATLRPGQTMTRKSYWETPWKARQDYYVDAIADDRRVIAVFSDRDLWQAEVLHLETPREFDRRPVAEFYCCGDRQKARGYPCPDCGRQFCPVCKGCLCDRRAQTEELCSSCFLLFQTHLLVGGRCEECRA
jgi:hypothetical protein